MTNKINNIILASIFIVPMASMFPIPGTIVWYPALLALIAMCFIAVAMLYWDTNKFISLFLIYGIFSYMVVCNQSPRAMLCLITGYLGILFSYIISISDTKKVFKAILIMASINATMVIAQSFKLDPIFIPSTDTLMDRAVGFMGSRNQLGIFHACITPILASISPWFVLLAFPIILIKATSAFVATAVGMILFLFLTGKKYIAVGMCALLLISIPVIIYYKPEVIGEFKERIALWKLTVNQSISGNAIEDTKVNPVSSYDRRIYVNPIFGFGIGNFFLYSPMTQGVLWAKGTHDARYEHAHNDLIEALFEFGYIGFILVMLSISKIISDFVTCLHVGHPHTRNLIILFCSLVTLSLSSLGIYVFHAPVSLFLFCLILGLFYREVKYVKSSIT